MTEPFLSPPPATFADARLAAHRLAVYVISPARRRATGRIGLRASEGGFTTPPFGDDESVRLEGTRLVRRRRGAEASEPVTTLAAGARFVLDGPPDVGVGRGVRRPAARRSGRPAAARPGGDG